VAVKATELIVKCLENAGVGYIFGVLAAENMDLLDPCRALGLGMTSERRNSKHATKYTSRLDPFSTGVVLPASTVGFYPIAKPSLPAQHVCSELAHAMFAATTIKNSRTKP
jgi:hypothetical protein